MAKRISWISAAACLTLAVCRMNAAELKPETVKAWDSYIQAMQARMEDRLAPGRPFLWADEDPKRLEKLRQGAIEVAPVNGHGSQAVPNGLIHDWMGAIFIPNTSLAQLIAITRDYDHYKDIYQPLVVDSRTIDKSAGQDHFSMRWVHKSLFVTSAIETEYCLRSVRVNDHKFYSSFHSTRVQEILDYGNPGEHKLPDGQGSGFIWKLQSINRYEERDGGVYVELEAVVLTRDIPASVRFMVKPVVTKLSRNSLLVSLAQTRDAVQSRQLKSNPPIQITQKSGNGLLAPNRDGNSSLSLNQH